MPKNARDNWGIKRTCFLDRDRSRIRLLTSIADAIRLARRGKFLADSAGAARRKLPIHCCSETKSEIEPPVRIFRRRCQPFFVSRDQLGSCNSTPDPHSSRSDASGRNAAGGLIFDAATSPSGNAAAFFFAPRRNCAVVPRVIRARGEPLPLATALLALLFHRRRRTPNKNPARRSDGACRPR